MQPPPPPSPTRSNPVHDRSPNASTTNLAPTASLSITFSASSARPHAPSQTTAHALQGATLAFNKQKATAITPSRTGPASPGGVVRVAPGSRGDRPQSPVSRKNTGSPTRTPQTTGRTGGRPGGNGALLAATQAAAGLAAKSPEDGKGPGRIRNQMTGQNARTQADAYTTTISESVGSNTMLSPPRAGRFAGGDTPGRQASPSPSPSPSLIAATLAASRSGSPARRPTPQIDFDEGRASRARGQSISSESRLSVSAIAPPRGLDLGPASRASDTDGPDTTSIPPTTSLVSLFESKQSDYDVDPVKKSPSRRLPSPENADRQQRQDEQQAKPKPKPPPKPKPTMPIDSGARGENEQMSSLQAGEPSENVRGSGRQGDSQPTDLHLSTASHQPLSDTLTSSPGQRGKPRPTPPKPRTQTFNLEISQTAVEAPPGLPPRGRRLSEASTSSNDTFVSASSVPSRPVTPTRDAAQRPKRPPLITPESWPRRTSIPDLQRISSPLASTPTPSLTVDSLANAMVASNLAAARLTSQSQPQLPPIPPPRRSGRTPGSSSPIQPQRTADSLKSQLTGGKPGMLQTLRGQAGSVSDDEEERRRRQQHHQRRRDKVLRVAGAGGNRKHAHHEAARRRWRDEITPKERRRYEAVWASNRGLFLRPGWALQYQPRDPNSNGKDDSWLHEQIEASRALPPAPEADLVVNIVVRDIWMRSRLPRDELAEVWDLVDRDRKGALGKDEFVVGMWLIDQRLRGRKIPQRVSQSVWESAGARGGTNSAMATLLTPEGKIWKAKG